MMKNLLAQFSSILSGLSSTAKHLWLGHQSRQIVNIKNESYFDSTKHGTNTVQYPKQQLDIPENGRYQLHVEINDCIVCDLCAKICPVNCIDIESIKSPTEIGLTSDGSKKRLYAARFDIDMAKCMFCGLCTIVCPTECIIMTNQYDRCFSQLNELQYPFATMNEQEIKLRKNEYEQFMAEKQAAKQRAAASGEEDKA